MRAVAPTPNGTCRGLRFLTTTYFSRKRLRSDPSHLRENAVLAAQGCPRSTPSQGPGDWSRRLMSLIGRRPCSRRPHGLPVPRVGLRNVAQQWRGGQDEGDDDVGSLQDASLTRPEVNRGTWSSVPTCPRLEEITLSMAFWDCTSASTACAMRSRSRRSCSISSGHVAARWPALSARQGRMVRIVSVLRPASRRYRMRAMTARSSSV